MMVVCCFVEVMNGSAIENSKFRICQISNYTRVSSINQELEVKHRTVNCYLKIVYHNL